MRVDPQKTAQAVQTLRFRAGIWIGVSIVPFLAGIASLSVVLTLGLNPSVSREAAPSLASLLCCTLFGVLVPIGGGVASIVAAVRGFRRAEAIEAILASTVRGELDREALLRVVGQARADGAVMDGLALGALQPPTASHGASAFQGSPTHGTPAPSHAPTPTPMHLGPGAGAPSPSMRPQAFDATLAVPTPSPSVRPAAPPMAPVSPIPATAMSIPVVAARAPSPTPVFAPGPPTPTPSPATPSPFDPRRPSTEQLVGQTLKGTWFIENVLAAGGMGCVYAARHVRTGRRYAIKTILPDERVSLESLHRFEREARTASSLGHVGIVQVHDFDLDAHPRFLVMDLLEGETVEARLASLGRLAWPDAKRITLEVADALAAAHRAGVLHRDLKPSNVFLSKREGLGERAVLLDFGLAKPIREGASVWVTRTGAVVGTAHYMAPEQARGERSIDQRADVYGLGALVYEMVAGVPPFLGTTPFAVLTSLLTEAPVPPSHLTPGLPPALDALLLSTLAKRPEERPQDVAAFVNAIVAIP